MSQFNAWKAEWKSQKPACAQVLKFDKVKSEIMSRGRAKKIRFAILSAAAAAVALLVTVGITWQSTPEVVPAELVCVQTGFNEKTQVVLPDESVVWLNANTTLTYSEDFIADNREVTLSGEAFFDVKPNPDTPMVVSTDKNVFIKVTGTKFNIRAYKNESSTKTTLYSGKRDVLGKNKEGAPYIMTSMKPNESYEVRENIKPLKVLKADTLKHSAWTRGELMFEYTPISDVIKELERWHGATFEIVNEKIYKHKFSARFKQESLVQILEVLKFCTGIEYEMSDDKVILK